MQFGQDGGDWGASEGLSSDIAKREKIKCSLGACTCKDAIGT